MPFVSWGFGSENQRPTSEVARIPLKINNIFKNIKRQTNIVVLFVPLSLLCGKLLVQIFDISSLGKKKQKQEQLVRLTK